MKKIGFVDFYISEWHANNYPQWIREVNQRLGTDFELAYAWAELDTSPTDGITTDQWCEKYGAQRCSTIAELCEKSDCILILAPSDPDKHLQYASQVLPFGKPTYIDKTFAPNLESAQEIFRIAGVHSTPFFSSSALRYAAELEQFTATDSFVLTGGGSSFQEYVIHLVEMAVILLHNPVRRVKAEPVGTHRLCRITAEDGTEAALVFSPAADYSIFANLTGGKHRKAMVTSQFFPGLIEDILLFFDRGIPSFPPEQTLEAMALRDALLMSESENGTWVEVASTL